ncbi:hypothetical protein KI387_032406 [Taxus chinensis]|uniref:Uncharacterized protein n=1 Tax=Taxus chinensis TaxID=29808 RepID=A0AA38C1N4_TAXCH|nr:hypothetical protein KI387_032406 [Taxus chinensis]
MVEDHTCAQELNKVKNEQIRCDPTMEVAKRKWRCQSSLHKCEYEEKNKEELQVSIKKTMKMKEALVDALTESTFKNPECEVEDKNEGKNGVVTAEVAENGPLIVHHVTAFHEKNARNSEELDNPAMKKMTKDEEKEMEEMSLQAMETHEGKMREAEECQSRGIESTKEIEVVDVFPSRNMKEDHGGTYVGAAHIGVEEEALMNQELHYVDMDKESESFCACGMFVMPNKMKKGGGKGKENEMVELMLLSSKACVEENDVAAERCLLEDMKIKKKDMQANALDANSKEELGKEEESKVAKGMTLEKMHMRIPNSHDTVYPVIVATVEEWKEIENVQSQAAAE